MFLLQQFAPGVLIGALVAFSLAIVTRWLPAHWLKQALFAAAVGAGYAAGHAKSAGWPSFPPGDATHWLLFSALAAIVLGFCYGIGPCWGRSASFVALVAGTLALLFAPKFKHGWTAGEGALWMVALAIAAMGTRWPIDAASRDRTRGLSPLWLLVATGGTSIALAMSGSILLGQLAAVLAAVVFGLASAAVIGTPTEPAIVPGLATLYIGLVACGYFYAELPWSSAVLLAIAPSTSFLIRGRESTKHDLLRAAIAVVPVVAAVALAFKNSPPIDYY